jgi:hypothetical protein
MAQNTKPVEEALNSDRLTIIKIIEQLHEDDSSRSVNSIIIKLDYSKILEKEGDMLRLKESHMSRLRDKSYNPSGNYIAGMLYSDILNRFKEKFPGYPRKGFLDEESIKKENHSDYYIYYYESYSVREKRCFIKFALVGFNRNPDKTEWENGAIYYLKDNKVHKIFTLSRINPPDGNKKTLFFKAEYKDQINFFTVQVNKKTDIQYRGIVHLMYSVIETQFGSPCAGPGILEKIIDNKFGKKIEETIKDGVRDEIANALYGKKYVLHGIVDDKPEQFTTNQMVGLNKAYGFWSGVYLRSDIGKDSDTDKGGICKFVLIIYRSGECELFYGTQLSKKYAGFLKFPFGGGKFYNRQFGLFRR